MTLNLITFLMYIVKANPDGTKTIQTFSNSKKFEDDNGKKDSREFEAFGINKP